MTTPTLITYNQTPEQHFFLCRQCRTHIARTQEFVFKDPMANVGILENAVNVEVAGEAHHRVEGERTLADVYCLQCRTLLGQKMIAVVSENIIAKKGRFILDMQKLLMWDGTAILYAHNFEPVENP